MGFTGFRTRCPIDRIAVVIELLWAGEESDALSSGP